MRERTMNGGELFPGWESPFQLIAGILVSPQHWTLGPNPGSKMKLASPESATNYLSNEAEERVNVFFLWNWSWLHCEAGSFLIQQGYSHSFLCNANGLGMERPPFCFFRMNHLWCINGVSFRTCMTVMSNYFASLQLHFVAPPFKFVRWFFS